MIVGLPELKQHLRIDGDDEDDVVLSLGMAAEQMIRSWLGRPVYADDQDMPLPDDPAYHPNQMRADNAVKVAIKMMTLRMHDPDRAGGGSVSEDAVPPLAVRALLSGHRVFMTLEVEECSQPQT